MPRPGWSGRRVTIALAQLYRSTHPPVCWLCGHHVTWQAKSIDHVLPASTHPQLEWTRTNWRLAHLTQAGTPTGCTHPGCTCIGNKQRRDRPITSPPTRAW